MDKRLDLAGPDIVFEEFDGDLVVLNLSTGRYFGFNPSAAVLWSALAAGVCPADLQAHLAPAIDLATFIGALHENALVVEGDEAPTPVTDDLRAQLAKLTEQPQLEIYDDLSDLIVADPIHDSDAAQGWPVRPAQG
ncbi:PqqD family protein [Fuscibacter oryzae]|uniref:PqqD family protein n=1 Tax=Fuscibacter oryzae TaxID=2803939 RepID=A0A8J7SVT6_9RHOB|nr:PqqD family protein [Fuscibacter oryzae]MBL4929011.1 PqqD family protein [Fuscibacter oryzae]